MDNSTSHVETLPISLLVSMFIFQVDTRPLFFNVEGSLQGEEFILIQCTGLLWTVWMIIASFIPSAMYT